MTLCDVNRRFGWIPAASAAIAAALILSQVSPASAQQKNRQRQAVNPSQFIPCAQTGQPLIRIPELVANEQEKVLHGAVTPA